MFTRVNWSCSETSPDDLDHTGLCVYVASNRVGCAETTSSAAVVRTRHATRGIAEEDPTQRANWSSNQRIAGRDTYFRIGGQNVSFHLSFVTVRLLLSFPVNSALITGG